MALVYPRTDDFDRPLPPFLFSGAEGLRLWALPFCLRSRSLLVPADDPFPASFAKRERRHRSTEHRLYQRSLIGTDSCAALIRRPGSGSGRRMRAAGYCRLRQARAPAFGAGLRRHATRRLRWRPWRSGSVAAWTRRRPGPRRRAPVAARGWRGPAASPAGGKSAPAPARSATGAAPRVGEQVAALPVALYPQGDARRGHVEAPVRGPRAHPPLQHLRDRPAAQILADGPAPLPLRQCVGHLLSPAAPALYVLQRNISLQPPAGGRTRPCERPPSGRLECAPVSPDAERRGRLCGRPLARLSRQVLARLFLFHPTIKRK